MNNLLGGHPPQRPTPQVTIKDTTEVTCDKCGGNVFQIGSYFRKVSALLSPSGKPQYIPIEQAVFCITCHHVNIEFIPPGLESPKISLV